MSLVTNNNMRPREKRSGRQPHYHTIPDNDLSDAQAKTAVDDNNDDAYVDFPRTPASATSDTSSAQDLMTSSVSSSSSLSRLLKGESSNPHTSTNGVDSLVRGPAAAPLAGTHTASAVTDAARDGDESWAGDDVVATTSPPLQNVALNQNNAGNHRALTVVPYRQDPDLTRSPNSPGEPLIGFSSPPSPPPSTPALASVGKSGCARGVGTDVASPCIDRLSASTAQTAIAQPDRGDHGSLGRSSPIDQHREFDRDLYCPPALTKTRDIQAQGVGGSLRHKDTGETGHSVDKRPSGFIKDEESSDGLPIDTDRYLSAGTAGERPPRLHIVSSTRAPAPPAPADSQLHLDSSDVVAYSPPPPPYRDHAFPSTTTTTTKTAAANARRLAGANTHIPKNSNSTSKGNNSNLKGNNSTSRGNNSTSRGDTNSSSSEDRSESNGSSPDDCDEEASVTDSLLPSDLATSDSLLLAQRNTNSLAPRDQNGIMSDFDDRDKYEHGNDHSGTTKGVYTNSLPLDMKVHPKSEEGSAAANGEAVAAVADGGDSSVAGDADDDGSGPCGWRGFQLACCQKFRDARWYLVVITLCGACQGMAVNGFVNTVISTVERRFEISSTESGLIASCYDIMFVLLVIPISYFGGQGHKPRYLGIGIFVLGLGSFVFSLPHFISESYRVESADETVCRLDSNYTSSCTSAGSSGLSNYKYFFFLGQLLHGAGATPLYTLGVTFMDENVPQRSSAFYNGIFYTGAIIGPAIGYMVGSEFLNIYTDIGVDPARFGLDSNNPKWVGAWWIGFLISGTFGVLLSLPLLAFPSALPGSRKYAAERGKEVQASSKVDQTGQQRGFMDILLSLKYLLTNIPFMLVNIAAAADGILVAGFSTFMPKYIEYQFGLSAGTAALYVGLAVVPAGGGATFLGGFLVRCLNLKVRGILRLCVVASFILSVLAAALLMQCDTTPFAGVTLNYGQTNVNKAQFLGKNLVSSCNANCSCLEEDYFPICGRDNVMYFSPCYAGCTDVLLDGDVKRYSNCSCISYNLTAEDYSKGTVHMGEFGKCEYKCSWLVLFMLCFSLMIVFVFITSMPSLSATLRCVPDHQRSFGLGVQWIIARVLGSIPGPILFGKMFDLACLVWQKRCDGDGSCFFYDNEEMSINLLILAIVFAVVAAFSFLLALCFYKVKEVDDEIALNVDGPSRQSSKNNITPTSETAPNGSHPLPRKSADGSYSYDNSEYVGTTL